MRPNAVSTTADSAIRPAIVRPTTVVIGIAALRSTCRRRICRHGRPRLTAVCTCSRSSSSRTAARVTRVTSATDVAASASAGSVRCWSQSRKPVARPQCREPAQLHREDELQHHRGGEGGHRRRHGRDQSTLRVDAAAAAAHRRSRAPPRHDDDHHEVAAPGSRVTPIRCADQGRDAPRAGGSTDRGHRAAPRQPVPVPDQERLVEVVARARAARSPAGRVPARRSASAIGLPGAR